MFDEVLAINGQFGKKFLANPLRGRGSNAVGKSNSKSLLLRNSSILVTFYILNKSEGEDGGGGSKGRGGGFGRKKLLLSPLLKNSFFSLSLFSLD